MNKIRRRDPAAKVPALFAEAAIGLWYDPSDLSTLFQDSAGTIPATVGNPVGLMMDKSGFGNHAVMATTGYKPTLQQDENGAYYIKPDGSDDYMATASIDFSAASRIVWACGVKKFSDAAVAMVFELSTNLNSNNGTFCFGAPFSLAVAGRNSFLAKGTTSRTKSYDVQAPLSAVFSGFAGIPEKNVGLRIDGALILGDTGDLGEGNFGNYPLYLFKRGGAQYPFGGNFYGLIIAAGAYDTARVGIAERYIARKMRRSFGD